MTHAKNHMQTVTLCHTNFRMVTFRNLATNNVIVTVTISRVTCDNNIEFFSLEKVTSQKDELAVYPQSYRYHLQMNDFFNKNVVSTTYSL